MEQHTKAHACNLLHPKAPHPLPRRIIRRLLFCLGMERADSGLDLIGTRPPHQEEALQDAGALADFAPIPARAILLFEQHHLAPRPDTRLATRIMQEL